MNDVRMWLLIVVIEKFAIDDNPKNPNSEISSQPMLDPWREVG
jgi:hypothetical protein